MEIMIILKLLEILEDSDASMIQNLESMILWKIH